MEAGNELGNSESSAKGQREQTSSVEISHWGVGCRAPVGPWKHLWVTESTSGHRRGSLGHWRGLLHLWGAPLVTEEDFWVTGDLFPQELQLLRKPGPNSQSNQWFLSALGKTSQTQNNSRKHQATPWEYQSPPAPQAPITLFLPRAPSQEDSRHGASASRSHSGKGKHQSSTGMME